MACIFEYFFSAINDFNPLHCSEVDSPAIGDFFGGKQSSLRDISDISPVSNLFSIPPDVKWRMFYKSSCDVGHSRVLSFSSLSINCKVDHAVRAMIARAIVKHTPFNVWGNG